MKPETCRFVRGHRPNSFRLSLSLATEFQKVQVTYVYIGRSKVCLLPFQVSDIKLLLPSPQFEISTSTTPFPFTRRRCEMMDLPIRIVSKSLALYPVPMKSNLRGLEEFPHEEEDTLLSGTSIVRFL